MLASWDCYWVGSCSNRYRRNGWSVGISKASHRRDVLRSSQKVPSVVRRPFLQKFPVPSTLPNRGIYDSTFCHYRDLLLKRGKHNAEAGRDLWYFGPIPRRLTSFRPCHVKCVSIPWRRTIQYLSGLWSIEMVYSTMNLVRVLEYS